MSVLPCLTFSAEKDTVGLADNDELISPVKGKKGGISRGVAEGREAPSSGEKIPWD